MTLEERIIKAMTDNTMPLNAAGIRSILNEQEGEDKVTKSDINKVLYSLFKRELVMGIPAEDGSPAPCWQIPLAKVETN